MKNSLICLFLCAICAAFSGSTYAQTTYQLLFRGATDVTYDFVQSSTETNVYTIDCVTIPSYKDNYSGINFNITATTGGTTTYYGWNYNNDTTISNSNNIETSNLTTTYAQRTQDIGEGLWMTLSAGGTYSVSLNTSTKTITFAEYVVPKYYLYFYKAADTTAGTEEINSTMGEFVETSTSGVYQLEHVSVSQSDIAMCVYQDNWTNMLGWKDGDGNGIAVEDQAYGLATADKANLKILLPVGSYTVTFDNTDTTNPTIKFFEETWRLYFVLGTDGNLVETSYGKFTETETSGTWTIDFTLPSGPYTSRANDPGIGFYVNNGTTKYGWGANIENLITPYNISSTNSGAAWIKLAADKFVVGNMYTATLVVASNGSATIQFDNYVAPADPDWKLVLYTKSTDTNGDTYTQVSETAFTKSTTNANAFEILNFIYSTTDADSDGGYHFEITNGTTRWGWSDDMTADNGVQKVKTDYNLGTPSDNFPTGYIKLTDGSAYDFTFITDGTTASIYVANHEEVGSSSDWYLRFGNRDAADDASRYSEDYNLLYMGTQEVTLSDNTTQTQSIYKLKNVQIPALDNSNGIHFQIRNYNAVNATDGAVTYGWVSPAHTIDMPDKAYGMSADPKSVWGYFRSASGVYNITFIIERELTEAEYYTGPSTGTTTAAIVPAATTETIGGGEATYVQNANITFEAVDVVDVEWMLYFWADDTTEADAAASSLQNTTTEFSATETANVFEISSITIDKDCTLYFQICTTAWAQSFGFNTTAEDGTVSKRTNTITSSNTAYTLNMNADGDDACQGQLKLAPGTYKVIFTYNGETGSTIQFDAIDVLGVENIETDATPTDNIVYNLLGIPVDPASAPSGIYIKNGKKFMIRK